MANRLAFSHQRVRVPTSLPTVANAPERESDQSMNMPYFLLLDANVWVAERLLQSSIGGALLYAVTGAGAAIALPEIVETETTIILQRQCEEAVLAISKAVRLLRQISQQQSYYTAPSEEALAQGIARRWRELDGLLKRQAFTHDTAKAALERVMTGTPPAGPNNEQFRDCCIWEVAISLAATGPVHLVTRDTAFFENRNVKQGLARQLRAELEEKNLSVEIHPTPADFLDRVGAAHRIPDEQEIGTAIEAAVRSVAYEKVSAEERNLTLELASPPIIKGYATPKPSTIAVSFEIRYKATPTSGREAKGRLPYELQLEGSCSYDPSNKSVSEISIRSWSQSLPGHGSGSTTSYSSGYFEQLTAKGQYRLIE